MKNILKILILIIFVAVLVLTLNSILNGTIAQNNVLSVSSDQMTEYEILVDVEDSKLFLLENNVLVKTYKCSGGKWSTPSPIGTWKIISKAKWGEGFRGKLATD